jgi:hypothetical protein
VKVSLVPIEHINAVWERLVPILEPAVAVTNGRYTTYDVYVAAQQSNIQLWIAFEGESIYGLEVTCVTDYPSKRVLTSMFTGGAKLREWRAEMMDVLVRWAKDNQCTAIEGYGRDGWVKMLEPYGVTKGLVMFEKEV